MYIVHTTVSGVYIACEYRIAGKSRWKKMYCYKKLTGSKFRGRSRARN